MTTVSPLPSLSRAARSASTAPVRARSAGDAGTGFQSPRIPPPVTPAEMEVRSDAEHCELIDGQLVEKTMSLESSWIGGEVLRVLGNLTREQNLGWVFGSDCAFRCFDWDRDRVRKPDVSFVSRFKLPERRFLGGFCEIVPDLAVEVISTHDIASEVETKIEEYLRAGVRAVWVIHPQNRLIEVFRGNGEIRRLHEQDFLTDEELFPGWRHPVAEFLPLPVVATPAAIAQQPATVTEP